MEQECDPEVFKAARSQQILNELEKQYPKVVKAMNINRGDSIKFLEAKCLQRIYNVNILFENQAMYASYMPWQGYAAKDLNAIRGQIWQQLEELQTNDGDYLKHDIIQAKDHIFYKILQEYSTKYPEWPKDTREYTSAFELNISGNFRTLGNFTVIWTAQGNLLFGEKNSTMKYQTICKGTIEVKALILNTNKLDYFDNYAQLKIADDNSDKKSTSTYFYTGSSVEQNHLGLPNSSGQSTCSYNISSPYNAQFKQDPITVHTNVNANDRYHQASTSYLKSNTTIDWKK